MLMLFMYDSEQYLLEANAQARPGTCSSPWPIGT